jgi:ribosome recycling factor
LPEGERLQVIERTKGKMDKAVDWARGVVFDGVERGRGKVSPGEWRSELSERGAGCRLRDVWLIVSALLDTVKVTLPDAGTSPLNAVASVTVRQMTLYVEVFDTDVRLVTFSSECPDGPCLNTRYKMLIPEKTMKHVESAINKANLPGLSPQRIDARSLKIPVSRYVDDPRAPLSSS